MTESDRLQEVFGTLTSVPNPVWRDARTIADWYMNNNNQ